MSYTAHNQRIVDQFTHWAETFSELPLHAEADAMNLSLAACELTKDARVLDVACGPGILACAMAPHVAHVTGIDITPAMIEQAHLRQGREQLSNVTWQVGNAAKLPFDDDVFDIVTTRYSFHHMPEPAIILQEMARVCRPDGRIVVIDATPSPQSQAAYDQMETLRDPSHTSARTLSQLREMGRERGLEEAVIDGYRLEAVLATLSDPKDMHALTSMFNQDIDGRENRIGVNAWRGPSGIHFYFPISVVAWTKPQDLL